MRVFAGLLLCVALVSACSQHSQRPHSSPSIALAPGLARTLPTTQAWPLTGVLHNASIPARPALSVKIDDAPDAKPQSGLNEADIVTEALVEGGLTRLLATFNSHDSALLGPIRSARPVDAALLRAFNGGIFAYSGAALGEIAPAKASSSAVLLSYGANPSAFRLQPGRYAPHNLYASTASLYAGSARRPSEGGLPTSLFHYGQAPTAASPADRVDVSFSGVSRRSWIYRSASHDWLRNESGVIDRLASGEAITAANVLVLSVQVAHSGIIDTAHNEDPYVLATGSGVANVYRDGLEQSGTWKRSGIAAPWSLTDSTGKDLTLRPGRTWVELVPVQAPWLPIP